MIKLIKKRIAKRRFRKQIIFCIKHKPKGVHLYHASFYYSSEAEKQKLITYVERILKHRHVKYELDGTLFKLKNANSIYLFSVDII